MISAPMLHIHTYLRAMCLLISIDSLALPPAALLVIEKISSIMELSGTPCSWYNFSKFRIITFWFLPLHWWNNIAFYREVNNSIKIRHNWV